MPWKPATMTTLPAASSARHPARVDARDARLAVAAVGGDAGLGAGQADRRDAQRVERHRDERRALVLAGREQDVELAGIGLVGDGRGERQQLVRRVAHRRHDDDQLRPARALAHDPPRDPLDALGAGDGRAAELHHDEGSGHAPHSSGGSRSSRAWANRPVPRRAPPFLAGRGCLLAAVPRAERAAIAARRRLAAKSPRGGAVVAPVGSAAGRHARRRQPDDGRPVPVSARGGSSSAGS